MSISQVIGWKFNNQAGMSTKGDVITEFPKGIPTQADQDLWTTEYEAHLASTEYARARATEYSALNQFEMQFDDQQNNTTTWVDAINDIKARFPK